MKQVIEVISQFGDYQIQEIKKIIAKVKKLAHDLIDLSFTLLGDDEEKEINNQIESLNEFWKALLIMEHEIKAKKEALIANDE